MPTNLSDDWRENGPTEDDCETDDDGNEIGDCESCGKRIIAGCCGCAEEEE